MGHVLRVIFEILKFTGVGHVTISRKISEKSKSFDHLEIGLVGKNTKNKHFSYKNNGLEMNGSKDSRFSISFDDVKF